MPILNPSKVFPRNPSPALLLLFDVVRVTHGIFLEPSCLSILSLSLLYLALLSARIGIERDDARIRCLLSLGTCSWSLLADGQVEVLSDDGSSLGD